jgi:hypothetical protein
VGARTDAARAEVVASRQLLLEEATRLQAVSRGTFDLPGRLVRQPARIGLAAAGLAFLVLRGPQRVYRGLRRIFLGPRANMPKSMLPKEIDKALRALGSDGEQVRGVLEREFAEYLERDRPRREARDVRGTVSELGGNLLRPITREAGKRMAKVLFSPDGPSFAAAMDRLKGRRRED